MTQDRKANCLQLEVSDSSMGVFRRPSLKCQCVLLPHSAVNDLGLWAFSDFLGLRSLLLG